MHIPDHPSGPHKMTGIVAAAQVTYLNAGNGCVYKPVVIEVNTHMGNRVPPAQGMEKYQIALP